MENMQNNKDYYTIDVAHIFRTLWKRIWIVILVGILAAGIGFGISAFVIEPDYSSSFLLYINNSSIDVGNLSIGQLNASQSLAEPYTLILKSRETLEMIIDKSGVDYTYKELNEMIEATSVNNTEIMRVTVTSKDPYEADRIADTISDMLPGHVATIIKGATIEVFDKAVPNTEKVAPNITRNTALAMLIGVVAAALVIAILAMMDDTIHNEEYIIETYNYPILAKVPNLMESNSNKHRKYSYYKKRDYSKEHH